MQRRDLTFRMFVSSTFSDLRAERDALQSVAFPRLRKYCEEHGARFQAMDLRWGVSDEAALDQQTMEICLSELGRCREVSPKPNFMVLIGQRDGWRPQTRGRCCTACARNWALADESTTVLGGELAVAFRNVQSHTG